MEATFSDFLGKSTFRGLSLPDKVSLCLSLLELSYDLIHVHFNHNLLQKSEF